MNGPLTQGQSVQLVAAIGRVGMIRKASKVAVASGWMLGISAALTAPFALGSRVAFLLAAALATLAWNEFRGRTMLDALDEHGADLLWKNQLGLMAVLVVYCLWAIRAAGSGPVDPSLAELAVLAPDLVDLMADLTIVVFQGVIVVTVLLQGGMARFHHKRIALLREYQAETPEWIQDVMLMMEGGGPSS